MHLIIQNLRKWNGFNISGLLVKTSLRIYKNIEITRTADTSKLQLQKDYINQA